MQVTIHEVSNAQLQTFEQLHILFVKSNLIILASGAITILKHLLGTCDKSYIKHKVLRLCEMQETVMRSRRSLNQNKCQCKTKQNPVI